MMHLEDYLVTVQLNDIEDIMYNDQIDEGKVKDALKKVWDFITGKNKKKKVKAAGSGEISKSKEDKLEEIDWNEIRKDIEFDDPLKRAKERAVQGGVEVKGIKHDDKIVALMAYKSRSKIEGYADCPYILASQIDKEYQGKGYLKQMVEKIYDICKANGQKFVLVSNAEYNSKEYWKNNNFDGTIEDPNDKDKAKAHYGECGKIVNSIKE